jgi:hypothetical protein
MRLPQLQVLAFEILVENNFCYLCINNNNGNGTKERN